MSLFQHTVVKKHLAAQGDRIATAYGLYKGYFHNHEIQDNILNSKEEQFQEGFLRELFVKVLGYTLNPDPSYNLITEKKNETDSKKADGAIIIGGEVVGVIELKDHKTTDLKSVEAQAFGYKNNHRKASYVVISNFEKLRFYIDNAIDFIEFNLFTLTADEFAMLWLCLAYENIASNLPTQLKAESVSHEDQITKQFYRDYSSFKRDLFADLTTNNPAQDRLTLFKKSQKLLDRLLFILFAEDGALLPPNSIRQIVADWEKLRELDAYSPLYDRLKKYFGYLNTGTKEIFAYNGGLFKPDEVLDGVTISDEVLRRHLIIISEYDFKSEVDVNILGHIFENSLTEIEEITNEIEGQVAKVGKRKKDGVFYTPRYITTYIVENTLGRLCTEKKSELGIDESEYFADRRRQKATTRRLDERLQEYRRWLLALTVCDPACGSGAFLNSALDFLMTEHRLIDEMTAKILGHAIAFPDIENAILEHNLYGVDINEESVEIARLALWLRTAKPHRKLNSLSDNIKCGNSLISDPAVAGDKAFDWRREFPHIFERGGFDVVIGNPPYGAMLPEQEKLHLEQIYSAFEYQVNSYALFYEKGIELLKEKGLLGFITPATFTYQFYFKKLRAFLQMYDHQNICKYFYEVFEDAGIGDAVTFIVCKCKNEQSNTNILLCNSEEDISNELTRCSYNDLVRQDGTYNLNKSGFNIEKLYVNSVSLVDVTNVVVGIKAYQKGKGYPKQTEEIVKNKVFTASTKIDETYIQCVIGKDFHRYTFITQPSIYLSYGKWLAEPRETAPFFDDEKIVLRQTADSLIANIEANQYVNLNNVYNIGKVSDLYGLKYLLALLNSRLFDFVYQEIAQERGRLFAEVKKINLAKLPIKDISPAEQQPFIDLANKMLSLNAELSAKRARFCKRLADNLSGVRITGALERFDELEFKQFLAELKKQKIALSLRQQDEWEEYFNENRTACQTLTTQITATDHQIDQMVYTLYGLTEAEILIIGKTN